MKAIPRSDAASDTAPSQAPTPEPATERRAARTRPSTVLPRLLAAFCLIGLVAVQRWLAALFDDDIMACIVAAMLTITILGLIKPAAFAPDRRS